MASCDVMPGTKATSDTHAAPSTAGGVTQVTSQSVWQRHMQERQGLPPAHLQIRTRFHTWAPGGRSFESCCTCSPGAPPPTQEGPAGGPVSGPWPASPDRIAEWASTASEPARTHQLSVYQKVGYVPGSFPRTVPCPEAVPSLLEATKLLAPTSKVGTTAHHCWKERSRRQMTQALRILRAGRRSRRLPT